MKAWKYSPNTYDVKLVKCHDDNSAINNDIGALLPFRWQPTAAARPVVDVEATACLSRCVPTHR